MDIHVCKQCGSRFVYCRKCVFRPVRYKDAGFCTKECYEASENVVESTAEEVVIEEVIIENNNEPLIEDILPIETEVSIEAEAETVVLAEDPIVETTTPIVKNETNTYKKKKNKYK